MKKETLNTRLEKIENLSRGSKAYQIVKALINGEHIFGIRGNMIRPCHTSGTGHFCTNLDYTEGVKNLLNKIGVKYVAGNDSPRGGKPGNYIKIITKIQ